MCKNVLTANRALLRFTRSRCFYALSLLVGAIFGATIAAAADTPVELASLTDETRTMLPHRVLPPNTSEYIQHYEIQGNCEVDLQKGLRRNGVRMQDGNIYDSATLWEMRWDYEYHRSNDRCAAENFEISVDVTTLYPKWVRMGKEPASLVEKWEAYQQGLVQHETLHRDMVFEAAADISRLVASLPPSASCDALDREIRSLSKGRVRRLRAESRAYDHDTGHGLTQGAVLN